MSAAPVPGSGLGPRGSRSLKAKAASCAVTLCPGKKLASRDLACKAPERKWLRAHATCAFWTHDSWVQACVEQVAPKAKRCQPGREPLQSEHPRTHAMIARCGLQGESVLEVGMCRPTSKAGLCRRSFHQLLWLQSRVMPVIELHIESLRTKRLRGRLEV